MLDYQSSQCKWRHCTLDGTDHIRARCRQTSGQWSTTGSGLHYWHQSEKPSVCPSQPSAELSRHRRRPPPAPRLSSTGNHPTLPQVTMCWWTAWCHTLRTRCSPPCAVTHPHSHLEPHHHHDLIAQIHPAQSGRYSNLLSILPRHVLCLATLFMLLLVSPTFVNADRNRFYHISSLCLRERVHPLYKKIDGAVITSKSESNLDCTITFQTDTVLQRFMLRFEKLALDCNDHLKLYDGAHTLSNPKAHLSCRSTRAEVGTIYFQSTFLTLHYTTDAYSKPDNGFRLVITAYKEAKNTCREYRCASQFCISRDLVCDGVNHCGDNSDEGYQAHCQEAEVTDTIIGLDPMLFVALVSAVFVACLVCVISVSVCLCRREQLIQRQRQRMALQQQYQMNEHQGTTPLMAHHNNNSYNSKLDGACTMITSLDYGATRNGGLVNSFTHTTLPNNFATMPHLHSNNNHNHSAGPGVVVGGLVMGVAQTPHPHAAQHVRFGTLPVRTSDKGPPPYPGANGTANGATMNGYGPAGPLPHSSQQVQQPVQTQVIYTAK